MRKFTSLLIALLVVLSLAVTALAADSTVTYSGRNKFDFAPGSEYHTTDLFDGFKGIMPGDELTETITIQNSTGSCDFIKVYLRADLHDDALHMSNTEESVSSMTKFLEQLTMTVTNESDGGKVVFQGAPSELDGLAQKVYLGTIRRGKTITLEAELDVPIDMGNAFANREGEVDWVFVVEEYDDARPDTPKTGDETQILPYVLLLIAGVTGMVILLIGKRRRQN